MWPEQRVLVFRRSQSAGSAISRPRGARFTVRETPKGAILATQRPGIGRMSDKTEDYAQHFSVPEDFVQTVSARWGATGRLMKWIIFGLLVWLVGAGSALPRIPLSVRLICNRSRKRQMKSAV